MLTEIMKEVMIRIQEEEEEDLETNLTGLPVDVWFTSKGLPWKDML